MDRKITEIKNQPSQAGITIVEMLLYIGLLTMFLTILTQVFVSAFDVQLESEATSALEQDGRFILTRLAYDIGRAQAVEIPAALGEEGTTLQLTVGGSSLTYSLTGQDLILTVGGGSGAVNSFGSRITNVSFKRVGNSGGKPQIKIDFTLTSNVERPAGAETRQFQTTVGLR